METTNDIIMITYKVFIESVSWLWHTVVGLTL